MASIDRRGAEAVTPPASLDAFDHPVAGNVQRTAPAPDPPAGFGPSRRTSVLVAVAVALLVAVIVVAHNRWVLHVPVFEDGDAAANAVLIDRATSLRLTVGNYSRLGFNHPGPALLYVQAAGEVVLHRWLGVAPEPFNGHALAIMLWNSALVGLAAGVVHRLTARLAGAVVLAAAYLALVLTVPGLPASTWMPHVYVAPFLLLVVAAVGVGTGRPRLVPLLVFAGGVLVHGHVAFVLFVAATTAVAFGFLLADEGWHGVLLVRREAWWFAVAGGLALVFALPIAAHTAASWPGELSKYAAYGRRRAPNPSGATARYVLAYWGRLGPAATVVELVAVGVLVAHAVAGGGRRSATARVALAVLATELVAAGWYARAGVDNLHEDYIELFTVALPIAAVALAAGLAATHLRGRAGATALAPAIAALALVAAQPGIESTYRGQPALPAVTASAAASAAGRTLLLRFPLPAWPSAVAIFEQRRRDGGDACVVDPLWAFMFTPQHVCTPAQLAHGLEVDVAPAGSPVPPGARLVDDGPLGVVSEPAAAG